MSTRMNMQTGRILVLAAAAALPALALAQFQVENSTGRMLDANNRLGSGGVNDGRQSTGGYNADDIVYGNVTRGRQFRGPLTSTDATAFRGNLDRPSDNLVRDAGPSVYQQGGVDAQFTGQRFYGDNRGVRPPAGFQPLTPGSVGAFQTVQPVYRTPGDLRIDDTIPNPDMSLSRPTQYIIPGISVDSPTAIDGLQTPDSMPSLTQDAMPSRDLMQRLGLDEARFREMRAELQKTASLPGDQQQANPNDLTVAPESPVNDPLNSSLQNDMPAQAMSGALNTQQSTRQQLLTPETAARESSQQADLRQGADRFRKRGPMTDEEFNRQFMKDWLAQEKAKQQREKEQAAMVQTPQAQQQPAKPGKLPNATEDDQNLGQMDRERQAMRQQQLEGQNKVEGILPPQPDTPPKIASFAEVVKATGLKNMLTDAEKAMQAGKFTQALDYYDGAAAVAPNNPLIMVGRAVAELGAGYYARAQIHLEQALSADSTLLMVRYDLKAFYGEDRLAYIVRDLKDLAQSESRQSRPMFLLAFIAYNLDLKNEDGSDLAADWLNMAEQRGGSKEFYDKLREYWKLNQKKEGQSPAPAVPTVAPAGAEVGRK